MTTGINGAVWESLYRHGHRLQYPGEMLVRMAHRYLDPERHRRVLDYGFGTGENLVHLARRGFSVAGVEVSESALTVARQRLAGLVDPDALVLHEGGRLGFASETFDAVIAWQVLCYNDDEGLRRALVELHRVLRPGGRFLAALCAPGDSRQSTGEPLGGGVWRLTVPGQDGCLLRVLEREEIPRYFPDTGLEVGSFGHEMGETVSRHWIVTYEKH
ncbi:MAG: class I SAM-dependent methyltransferase [Gammaproteobacteria bacterium]|nr:MAG: class I SAM-dependent methyltransferase [Gammaproteobacteria bacterium]